MGKLILIKLSNLLNNTESNNITINNNNITIRSGSVD